MKDADAHRVNHAVVLSKTAFAPGAVSRPMIVPVSPKSSNYP